MFLACTADQRFWNKKEKTLFLGEWCKLYRDRDTWQNLEHETLPYHWDDRERFYRDCAYLNRLYEKALVELARALNAEHGTRHGDRYWRIVIGPWLSWFIEMLFDRFTSIQLAVSSEKAQATTIGHYEEDAYIPRDFNEFQEWQRQDGYNQFLYSAILRKTAIPFREIGIAAEKRGKSPYRSPARRLKAGAKFLFHRLSLASPESSHSVSMVGSYLSARDQTRLNLKLGQVPSFFFPKDPVTTTAPDIHQRNSRKVMPTAVGNTEFEALLGEVLFRQIPLCYLEDYSFFREASLGDLPRNPKAILTAIGPYYCEKFKFWAAEKVESGTRLILEQHGGHYGTGRWSTPENHELAIPDAYLTWGWKDSQHENTIPLSSGKLARAKNAFRARPDGPALWATMSLARYSYCLYSVPIGPQVLRYIEDQIVFGKSLSTRAKMKILLRAYPAEYGWNELDRYRDAIPEIRISDREKTFHEELGQCSLYIGSYNSTTFLETFAANYPTLLFWDPGYWDLRPEAEVIYKKLETAGIFHPTPESAARKAEEILDDPYRWWTRREVQLARLEFCEAFARSDASWIHEWASAIRRLIASPAGASSYTAERE